jgi:small subunit ribosomal protein S16
VAVKIKLKRLGKIREPYYRVVIADARTKRDGRAIEEIGKYHPKAEPSLIEINSERVQYWLSVGAQPTEQVHHLLTITGDWQKFKGLPGAEGTLRTAEPKADKKEAFAAAAKESLAAKEAKESKSGSKTTKAAAKDTSAKAAPAKDTSARDTSARDTAKAKTDRADKPAKADAEAAPAEAAPAEAAPEAVTAEATPPEAAPEAVTAEATPAEAVATEAPAAAGDEAAVSTGEGGTSDAEPGSGA